VEGLSACAASDCEGAFKLEENMAFVAESSASVAVMIEARFIPVSRTPIRQPRIASQCGIEKTLANPSPANDHIDSRKREDATGNDPSSVKGKSRMMICPEAIGISTLWPGNIEGILPVSSKSNSRRRFGKGRRLCPTSQLTRRGQLSERRFDLSSNLDHCQSQR
jgi:hypothetical protein